MRLVPKLIPNPVDCSRDRFVRADGGLLLKARDCIYDSLLIPNDVVYPV